ncbi:hypothetical protein A6P39_040245 [Streptomyces sp. FXJ1.172]|uniref:hypothetical protein n=1 Tax=Streptomyces sp. FXJ1.172 TaxID=710705 RepID=UPI0007CFFB9A|nr:hypothetical protein [Streptomyces sp. FXJ1.172]WEO99779.1 hypothetical protein A6P39_040245 [Streptomyces sp. FXJ1.172]
MPVKYIEVDAKSELFVPATRAFGDIAIVGQAGVTARSPDAEPQDFTSPSQSDAAYPSVRTELTADAAAGATTITTQDSVAVSTTVTIGTGTTSESATVAKVDGTGPFTLTLAQALAKDHAANTPVQGNRPPLAAAIATAFSQSPPPTRIWGVPVDATNPDWKSALDKVQNLDVQIVLLANTPLNKDNAGVVGELAKHVVQVSEEGGDGKERIGVAMINLLDGTLAAKDVAGLNAGDVHNERMFLVAHKSADDVAAATAGVIAGYEPHISMLLKPISISMPGVFSDSEIDVFVENHVNWITSPSLIPGHSLFLGEGYTADPSRNKAYIDIVRTIDDVTFRIKAVLIQAIGNLRTSRSGLRSAVTLVQSVLGPLVGRAVIEDYAIHIPLLTLLEKDPQTLSAAEQQEIRQAQSNRTVDMEVSVVYAGAIHRLHIDLTLT